MDHQSPSRLNNIGGDSQNEEHEKHFPESINNGFSDYSDGLLQPADMIEPDNVNSHINRSPSSDGILRMSYENIVLGQNEQQSMPQPHQIPWSQCSPPRSVHNGHILQDVGNMNNNEHIIPTMQCPPPLCSAPMQQLQHEQTLQHPTIQQCTRNGTRNGTNNNQHQNSKQSSLYDDLREHSSNTNELFKIEISGIEIVIRRKLADLNQNYLEMQDERSKQLQQNGKYCLNLKNPTKRNRMHPYRMPMEQNKSINRDHSVVDHCSCCPTISQVSKQQK